MTLPPPATSSSSSPAVVEMTMMLSPPAPPSSSQPTPMAAKPSSAAAGISIRIPSSSPPPPAKWRSAAQHRIYSRRLVEALRAARSGPRAIKDAADSALALTARGSSRWSRAILAGRCRGGRKLLLKAGGKIRRARRPSGGPSPSPPAATAMKDEKVRDRLRTLARLVPGCRKLPTPVLLKEAADYVAALEMQVRTMRALAEALARASVAAAPPPEG